MMGERLRALASCLCLLGSAPLTGDDDGPGVPVEIKIEGTQAEETLFKHLRERGVVILPADPGSLLREFSRQEQENGLEATEKMKMYRHLYKAGHLKSLTAVSEAQGLDRLAIDYADQLDAIDLAAVAPDSVVEAAVFEARTLVALDRKALFKGLGELKDEAWFAKIEFDTWEVEREAAYRPYHDPTRDRTVSPQATVGAIEKLDLQGRIAPELREGLGLGGGSGGGGSGTAVGQATCEQAINDLDHARRACPRDCFDPTVPETEERIAAEQEVLRAAKPYDRLCLASLADRGETADELPEHIVELSATRVVGVLEARGPTALDRPITFCGALILGPKRIATARHCFYDKYNFLHEWLAGRKVVLHRSNSPDREWPVHIEPVTIVRDSEIRFGDYVRHENDYLVLEIDGVLDDVPPILFEAPYLGEPLWVYGHYSFFDRSKALRVAEGAPDWYTGMRWTKAAQCAVLAEQRECVIHSCQTEQGYSGTPIISSWRSGPGGEIVVVGLQLAAPGRGVEDCRHLDPGGRFNAGLSGQFFKNQVLADLL